MIKNSAKSRFECKACRAHVKVDDVSWWYLCESCQFYVWFNFTVLEGQGDEQRLICTTCREKEWSSASESESEK
jgi:hypothetical protein